MKRVIYISGSRADFNLMSRTLVELKKYVDLTIFVTGMHFSKKWGRTIEEIKRYNFKIEKVKVPIQANSLSEMLLIPIIGILIEDIL